MQNIFQGNSLIKKTIAKTLGYEDDQKYSWFTGDMYFQAFFYLSKRFGNPSGYDEYKEAGRWCFKVKHYVIEISMNSSWVEFCIFGKIGNLEIHSPYHVKLRREWINKRELLLSESGEWNETEMKLSETIFEKFLSENNVDNSLTQEQFDEQFGMKWYKYICKYNHDTIGIDYKEFGKLHGELYQNSYTRHALKTLEQFLKNMLTPIWIRDVAYNIKGQISDEDASYYSWYKNNVKIDFEQQS